MEKRIPDFYMEQLILGELPIEKELELKNHSSFLSQKKELEKSNREILEAYPASEMAEKIRQRLSGESKILPFAETNEKADNPEAGIPGRKYQKLKYTKFFPLLAAAALALAVILPLTLERAGTVPVKDEPGTVRLKGLAPELKIYRKFGDQVEILKTESLVKKNDLLQLSYVAAGKKYGAILSLDGNGFVTLHYPASPTSSLELQTGGEIPLDFSYQLDDAPGFERFFFITSDSYFSLTQIMDEAARLAGSFYTARNSELKVPAVCETETILLIKENLN